MGTIFEFVNNLKRKPFIQSIMNDLHGEAFLVGGATRDLLLGKQNKDVDLVIRLVNIDTLLNQLRKFGSASIVGKSFGVITFKDNSDGEIYDVALPRTEFANGDGGHKGFDITYDENLPIEKDLIRRDAKFNAIAINLNTNQIIDPHGGLDDIKNKQTSLVNPDAFTDDPLRLLRFVGFTSRNEGFKISPDSMAKIHQTAHRIKEISPERILKEFEKIVEKGSPESGAKLLVETTLYQNIFDTQFKGSFAQFAKVKTLAEFMFLLMNSSIANPAKFYIQHFGDYGSLSKIISAFELTRKEINTPAEERWLMNTVNKIDPKAVGSFVVQDKLKDASMHPEERYPRKAADLAVTGGEIDAMGITGGQHGQLNTDLLNLIYGDQLENTREAVMGYIQQNFDKYKSTPQKIREISAKILQEHKPVYMVSSRSKEYADMDIDYIDRQVFGFAEDDIKTIDPKKLHVKYKVDIENAYYQQQKSGLNKVDWAKTVDLSEPIQLSYEKGKFWIEDGHHRYYAALILGKPLNVDSVEIRDKPHITAVKQAIAAGKKIPQEVLDDYPELSKQPLHEAEGNLDGNFEALVQQVKQRVPSLAKYNEFPEKNYDHFQLLKNIGTADVYWHNQQVKLTNVAIISELKMSYRNFNEKKWYDFNLKNQIFFNIPDTFADQMQRFVMQTAFNMLNDKYSYSKELVVNENTTYQQSDIDAIINELNRKTFEFEDHVNNFTRTEIFEQINEGYEMRGAWFIPDGSGGGRLVPTLYHSKEAMHHYKMRDHEAAFKRALDDGWVRIVYPFEGTSWAFNGSSKENIIKALQKLRTEIIYGSARNIYIDYKDDEWETYSVKDPDFLHNFGLLHETKDIVKQITQKAIMEAQRSQLKRLVLFDMDSTLINSPMPEFGREEYKQKTGGDFPSEKAWWSVPESLDTNVFEITAIAPVFNQMRDEQRRSDTMVVVMTNRLDTLEREVKRVLRLNRINPDALNMASYAMQNKGERILQILKENPSIRYVAFYDDQEKNIMDVRNALRKKGITYDLYNCQDGKIRRT